MVEGSVIGFCTKHPENRDAFHIPRETSGELSQLSHKFGAQCKCGPSQLGAAKLHSKAGQAVLIEPGLQPESPENGNNSMTGRRLLAFSPCDPCNWEAGDRPPNCKSPPSAGFSATS
jgi:hypothetical protein